MVKYKQLIVVGSPRRGSGCGSTKQFGRTCFKFTLLLVIVLCLIVVLHTISKRMHGQSKRLNVLKCYSNTQMYFFEDTTAVDERRLFDIQWLDDMLQAKRQPRPGKTIFFHVTSCLNGVVDLTARQACAIESAARTNPSLDIFVLFASPVGFDRAASSEVKPAIKALRLYENVFWRNVNLWAYGRDTPAEEWIHQDTGFLSSDFFVSHLSDYLRFISLYRYGGTHVDLDVIMKRPIFTLEPNYAGAESSELVAVGILNFDHTGAGHRMAEYCIREFVKHYDGNKWNQNGPGVLTHVLNDICRTNQTELMRREHCAHFNVMPRESFYAIPYTMWKILFEPGHEASVARLTEESIAIHFWNRLSYGTRIRIGATAADATVAYESLAKEHCPHVYQSCDQYF